MMKTWDSVRGALGDAENLRLCQRGPGRCCKSDALSEGPWEMLKPGDLPEGPLEILKTSALQEGP